MRSDLVEFKMAVYTLESWRPGDPVALKGQSPGISLQSSGAVLLHWMAKETRNKCPKAMRKTEALPEKGKHNLLLSLLFCSGCKPVTWYHPH